MNSKEKEVDKSIKVDGNEYRDNIEKFKNRLKIIFIILEFFLFCWFIFKVNVRNDCVTSSAPSELQNTTFRLQEEYFLKEGNRLFQESKIESFYYSHFLIYFEDIKNPKLLNYQPYKKYIDSLSNEELNIFHFFMKYNRIKFGYAIIIWLMIVLIFVYIEMLSFWNYYLKKLYNYKDVVCLKHNDSYFKYKKFFQI